VHYIISHCWTGLPLEEASLDVSSPRTMTGHVDYHHQNPPHLMVHLLPPQQLLHQDHNPALTHLNPVENMNVVVCDTYQYFEHSVHIAKLILIHVICIGMFNYSITEIERSSVVGLFTSFLVCYRILQ